MRRRYWRASALAGIFGLVMSVSTGVGLAAAHPGDGDETDAEHAKEDLASTSINQIEKASWATPETKADASRDDSRSLVCPVNCGSVIRSESM